MLLRTPIAVQIRIGSGPVYVVEFWAALCSVLHALMAHLAELGISVKNSARWGPASFIRVGRSEGQINDVAGMNSDPAFARDLTAVLLPVHLDVVVVCLARLKRWRHELPLLAALERR
jgi:hypothetical protein